MEQINILVFPCGSEIGLELHRALKDIRFIKLFGGSSVSDHGEWVYKNYIGDIPFITAPDFTEKINRIIDENKIDFIFPALDSVIEALSIHSDALHAKVLYGSDEAAKICRSKIKTYKALEGCDFLPKVYENAEEVDVYPVIIKPDKGQGSQGFMVINDSKSLVSQLNERSEKQVICEYLPGEEYTVDCFTDRHGKLKFVSCRVRNRIKNGISVNSSLVETDERIREIARQINSKINFRGVWFFQVKKDKSGEYKLLECAARVAGTMCLERAIGVNPALLSVFDAMETDIDISPSIKGAEVSRALYNVYKLDIDYDEVYIDFDDTLIVHGSVNFTVLRFIYQCVEKKKKIILLTRHETDVREDMKKYKIHEGLFDEIICIPRSEEKINHVSPGKKALFIDDSFAERKAMHEKFGVTALGVDSVEALIDERL